MIEVCAWQAETRFEAVDENQKEKGSKKIGSGEMAMGVWGRVAALERILRMQKAGELLRVLAAPEFMFRDTKNHWQTAFTKNLLVEELCKLSDQNHGVLLLPGSIPWVEKSFSDPCMEAYSNLIIDFKSKENIPTKSAKKALESLSKHAHSEKKRLNTETNVYLARNSLYGFYDGKIVLEYHKRYEALDENGSQEIPEQTFDGKQVFFPPQTNSPIFTVKNVTFGVEICADHEFGSLKAEQEKVDVHVIVSDEVYPVLEHSASKHLLHAGRVLSGVHNANLLPSIDILNIEKAEEMIRKATSMDAKSVNALFGPMHFGRFPVP